MAASSTLKGKPNRVFTVAVAKIGQQSAPYNCPLFSRGGHHPTSPKAGQVVVGFENWYKPGTEPFPCWEHVAHAYRGYVRFGGLSQFFRKSPARSTFANAYLRFTLVDGRRVSGTVAYERAYWSALRRVGTVTRSWGTGGEDGRHVQRSGFHGATLYNTLPVGKDLRVSNRSLRINVQSFRVNVSDIVHQWVCGEDPNRGFALLGPNETYAKNNDAFVSIYQNFELVVEGIGTRRFRRC